MSYSKRANSYIVNDVLAFLQNKLLIMDGATVHRLCLHHYSEEQLAGARVELAQSTATPIPEAPADDLGDMIHLLQQLDPDDVPTYLARDLNNLPSFSFDNTGFTEQLTHIRRKLHVSERASAAIRHDLKMLKREFIELRAVSMAQHRELLGLEKEAIAEKEAKDVEVSRPRRRNNNNNKKGPQGGQGAKGAKGPGEGEFTLVESKNRRRQRRRRDQDQPAAAAGRQSDVCVG